ncbi:hypothetical protein OGZ01_14780 [Vibrio harveyi]|nr:hypothetical protein [Vibrio harveyi]
MDVTKAIEESVDSFFYQTAFDLGIDRISKWMNKVWLWLANGYRYLRRKQRKHANTRMENRTSSHPLVSR